MKHWGFRILMGVILVGIAASTCWGVVYLALAIALRPTHPPALQVAGVRRLNRDAAAYHDPAWSPDGRYLAYARGEVKGRTEQPSEIYAMDMQTGRVRQLTHMGWESRHPSWSPDGTKIAFSSTPNAFVWPSQIWVMNADGTEATQVSRCSLSCSEPEWSPDGQKLLVVMSPAKGEPAQLYLLDPATGALEQLTNNMVDALNAAWSPDGTYIAYTETDLSPPSSWPDLSRRLQSIWSYLVIVDGEGRNARRLTTGSIYNEEPAWSPTGRYLAFVSERPTQQQSLGSMRIFILDLETGEVFPFLEGEFERSFAQPAWSPDGRYIAFVYGWPSATRDLYVAEVPESFR